MVCAPHLSQEFFCMYVGEGAPSCLEHDDLCLSILKQQQKGRTRRGIATLAGKPPQQKPGQQSPQALGRTPWRGRKRQLEKRTQTVVGMSHQRRMVRAPAKARRKRIGRQLLRKPECRGHSTSKVGCGALPGASQALYYEQAAQPRDWWGNMGWAGGAWGSPAIQQPHISCMYQ